MTDQDHKNMVATTFEILVLSTLGLAALIYDAPRLWIAIAAIWTVLLAVFFGFALGHSAVARRE
mgnify:CR=1 FL=1